MSVQLRLESRLLLNNTNCEERNENGNNTIFSDFTCTMDPYVEPYAWSQVPRMRRNYVCIYWILKTGNKHTIENDKLAII